jgi:ankyrin repeat protein
VNGRDQLGWSVLRESIWQGHESVVRLLLDFKGIDVHIQGPRGSNPLFYAADVEYIEILKELLDRGLDVNSRDQGGQTALFCAAENRELDIVEQLIKSGGKVNLKDNLNQTAEILAARGGYHLVVHILQLAGIAEIPIRRRKDLDWANGCLCWSRHLVGRRTFQNSRNLPEQQESSRTARIFQNSKNLPEL